MKNTKKKFSFCFGTKSETLLNLKDKLKYSVICDIISFTIEEYEKNQKKWLQIIRSYFGDKALIIRSSAINEDSATSAMAGYYVSIPNVSPKKPGHLKKGIQEVVNSYKRTKNLDIQKCQILIQPMVTDVSMSGVVFTQELSTGAPYYVINYDDESGRTDTITSGDKTPNKTVLIFRNTNNFIRSVRLKKLIKSIREIEDITRLDTLDIEFAISQDEVIYIFQVRPLTTKTNWNRGLTLEIEDALKRISEFLQINQSPCPGVYGDRSIYGQMPDWNPVEMIGISPRPLALSLYRHLITDQTWRKARKAMGYHEPIGSHLMASFYGKPYIDVRLSLNSFLPESLNSSLKNKIVNSWLTRLENNPEMHDKIEFEVAITAYSFNIKSLVDKLMPGTLTTKEYQEFYTALLQMTDHFICGKIASIEDQLTKIETLKSLPSKYAHFHTNANPSMFSALLESCIEFGTIPFSILARHAFISKSILTSLIDMEIISQKEVDLFMNSVQTIAGELVADAEKVRNGILSQSKFLKAYGHLRPGTYDILSLRYDQRMEFLLPDQKRKIKTKVKDYYSFSSEKIKKINQLMEIHGFKASAENLTEYIIKSIQGREYAKFVFTRILSDVLEMIAYWGEKIGLSREEISFLSISEILNCQSAPSGRTLEHDLRKKSQNKMEEYHITQMLHLPHLILKPEDVFVVPFMRCRPNFITHLHVHAPSIFLDGHGELPANKIKNKIVMIESADPGFDWIFTQNISGLVTKFGGANSHMAIRCAELKIPAAIGCGEQIFDRLRSAKSIDLDCSKGLIKPGIG